jgi:hypothetical protein
LIKKQTKANGKMNSSLLIASRANIQVLNKRGGGGGGGIEGEKEKLNDVVRTNQKPILINTENNTHLWNHGL